MTVQKDLANIISFRTVAIEGADIRTADEIIEYFIKLFEDKKQLLEIIDDVTDTNAIKDLGVDKNVINQILAFGDFLMDECIKDVKNK